MKKKLLTIFLLAFFLFNIDKIYALSSDDIKNYVECEIVELAEANTDGSMKKIECYENYEEAKKAMLEIENDNLFIIENNAIIDAKYALVDYDVDFPRGHKKYIDVYISATSNDTNGAYIRSTVPDDAALIETNYDNKRVKIKVAGVTGWINKYDDDIKLYDIVPLAWVKSPQYYKVTKDEIIHYFPGNIYDKKGESSYAFDQKPSMLDEGKYYSYDGHYFYKDLKTLLSDYKNDNYDNAVNKDTPYYNYYQYLSLRTETVYEKENIDEYINKRTSSDTSKMRNTGEYFINVQNKYNINAIILMAIGMNESGRGTSPISQTKNNLFGLNAIDQTPGESADYFKTVEDCIEDYAYVWMDYGFLDPADYRFKGANLGNKLQGLNYKYASDPFWSEKAAAYYYDLDKMYDFQDYNAYQIAVLNNNYNDEVYPKKKVDGEVISTSFYQYKLKNSSVIILEELEGPEINGNKIWYKIQSDATLDENNNYTGDSKCNPRVTYNKEYSVAYVPAVYFQKINTKVENTSNKPEVNPNPPEEEPESPPPEEKPIEISKIVNDAGYQYGKEFITGIKLGTDINDIKNNLTNIGGIITVTDINGNNIENGKVATGMKINITSGITETLTVVIYGDVSGDGEISAVDYVKVKNHIMGLALLNGEYIEAADANKDSTVSAVDYVNIKNYIMGANSVIER